MVLLGNNVTHLVPLWLLKISILVWTLLYTTFPLVNVLLVIDYHLNGLLLHQLKFATSGTCCGS